MTTKCVNPANGELICEVPNTPVDTMPQIMQEARAAQKIWREMSFKERSKYIMRAKDWLRDHADECAEMISKCNGKTRIDALATEVLPCLLACEWYGKNAETYLSPRSVSSGHILFANKKSHIQYVPVGVAAVISPWNYPFTIPFGEVIMGLMAGNAILLKVASQTIPCGEYIHRCLEAAGIPKGLFHHLIINGWEITKVLLANRVDKIFFTGSVPNGIQLMRDAAETLTPLSLELGGKDAVIVCEDADLERATNGIIWAGYQNAGQSCGGVERVYVHSSIYQKFVDMMAAKTRALRHGPDVDFNTDMGCITTKGQLKTIQEQVEDAVHQGSIIVAQSQPVGEVAKGQFFPATLLINVNHNMRIMKEETFGPVIPVMPFDSVDEAIRLANDCDLALTSSVWTSNMKMGKYIAERMECGTTTINDHLYTHGCSELPWGGWKMSGLGRTHGVLGLREMCNAKIVNWDMLPSAHVPRNIWWYPFGRETYAGLMNGVMFVAPKTLFSYLTNTLKLAPWAVKKMVTPWTVPGLDASARRQDSTPFFVKMILMATNAFAGMFTAVIKN